MSNSASFSVSSPIEAQMLVEETRAAATKAAEGRKAEQANITPQTNVSRTVSSTFQDGRQTLNNGLAISTTVREPIQPGMVRLSNGITTTLAAAKTDRNLLSSVVEYNEADRASFQTGR